MPIYEYRCPACGVFEQNFSMSSVPKEVDCTHCASKAKKLISAVGLSHIGSERMKMIDSTQSSAYEPQVISSQPSPAQTNYTRNPLHMKLPRP
ncbi:FmdB family zinc ribbon protein [Rothia aerolata]|uniref:FmdB family zinc ribbon protein n=1 Tax=Rothia aerolata TaxID=1812262 RepID=UPI001669F5DC|nr:zinc ribbon domain-containing protein [Rothia aerolata]